MGWSTNEKAQEKREKQQTKKREKQRERQQKVENAKWKDQVTDKKVEEARKKERKRQQQLAKKHELKKLAEEEEQMMEKQSLKKNKNEFNEKKLTQAQIRQIQEERLIAQFENGLNMEREQVQLENPNRNEALEGYQMANTVEKALDILNDSEQRHPERRFKAAFEAYCEKREQQIKLEYPKFKRSQRMQMMKREFQKHPQNPYNKKNVVKYNHKPKKQEEAA